MDVSFAFCIFVRPVLSVTNEGKEGFHQRLIERQARGGNVQSSGSRRQCGNCAEVGLNVRGNWGIGARQRNGREEPQACVVLMWTCANTYKNILYIVSIGNRLLLLLNRSVHTLQCWRKIEPILTYNSCRLYIECNSTYTLYSQYIIHPGSTRDHQGVYTDLRWHCQDWNLICFKQATYQQGIMLLDHKGNEAA